MKRLFQRWSKKSTTASTVTHKTGEYLHPKSAQVLLSSDRRQALLDQIWEQTSISRETYQTLYMEPITRYAELVQELPASETHHHSYLGGMLDHGLELLLYALKLRQSYLLPIGAPPEDQAKYADLWTAGIAYGALLHDTGKILVDIKVETLDGKAWQAWHGILKQPYRFQYIKGRDYNLHNAAAMLLCSSILGKDVLDWLSSNLELWGSLLYLLSGNYTEAGVLGEIVSKADRTSTALNIGANPEKALQAPPTSLQAHLIRGLRQLLKEEEHRIKLNMKGAAGWLTQDGLWLVSKVVADKLRSFLLSQGVDKVPTKNSSLFDELQSHRLIEPNAEGNAIWKATVTDGDWVQEFTFLRVKPSLIWGNEEYPSLFGGSVTFDGQPEANNDTQAPITSPAATPTKTTVQATPAIHSVTVKPVIEDDIDDVLSLFDDPSPITSSQEQSMGDDDSLIPCEPFESPSPQPITTAQSTWPNTEPAQKISPTPPKASLQVTFTTNTTAVELGTAFFEWLKAGVQSHILYINDSKALIHIVDGKMFIASPGIFQRFTSQFPELEKLNPDQGQAWRWVQKSFEKLKLHHKTENDLNIWTCGVRGPRVKGKSIKGYLLPTELFFNIQPVDNPFVTIEHQ